MARTLHKEAETTASGETGFADVTYDLIAVQYHALKAGHDYGQYVRDAENAGLNDIAQFFRDTMKEEIRAPLTTGANCQAVNASVKVSGGTVVSLATWPLRYPRFRALFARACLVTWYAGSGRTWSR